MKTAHKCRLAALFLSVVTGLPWAAGADEGCPLKDNVVAGRFGTALNAVLASAESARPLAAYKTFPLTVELLHRSLSEADRASYKPGPAPLDAKGAPTALVAGAIETPAAPPTTSLDGAWQLVEGGAEQSRLTGSWKNALTAAVPGSVHTALNQAGVIPFPFFRRNQEIARRWSFKTYWYKKTFPRPSPGQDQTLVFQGVCNRCTIWLNGKKLGGHEGMFTRIEFPVHDLLRDENTLIVKLDPAIEWRETVVFNNSYGWHYSKFPPLGIWRSVAIRGEPAVKAIYPFVATRDAKAGIVDLLVTSLGPPTGWAGKLSGVVSPDNFQGESFHFERAIDSTAAEKAVHLTFTVPHPRLWQPVGTGDPNLYRLKLVFRPDGGGWPDVRQVSFGIRTVQMAPVAGRRNPRLFDWTFVINGQPMFVKGTGWCTCDAMMDFSRARYDRLLTLAASQNIQMLRAWGSGMVETDDFYDLCDRKGIMVMQEWPTAWDSHDTQPYDLLEQTVREGTLRLRNHPSLAIYTGGNESRHPFGRAIDMMGRLNVELDGTRDFHRGEPFGGSAHDYDIYWGNGPMDHAFTMQAVFYGEFGIAAYPCFESMQKVLPDDEKTLWPPPGDKCFAYHTPVFNTVQDLQRLTRLSRCFTEGKTMQQFIVGGQLAQAVGVRQALERARTRWPDCTGALYYKLNDNSPAASWSTVDWFGAAKISHYFIQRSFAPLLAVAVFPRSTTHGEPLTLPVFLLDDAGAAKDSPWEVVVRAYDAGLKQIKEARFHGTSAVKSVTPLGEFQLSAEQTKTMPLLVVTDVLIGGAPAKRNYYFTNFEPKKDCLFNLPRTKLAMTAGKGRVTVKNEGTLPAVGVSVSRPGHADTFFIEENYFWLDAGESKSVLVNDAEGTVLDGWNKD